MRSSSTPDAVADAARRPHPPPSEVVVDDVLDQTRVAREVGFRSGIAHLKTAIERMGKRVAALLALFGFISTPISVGFGYWVSTRAVSHDRYAEDETLKKQELERRDREIASLRLTVDGMRERLAAVEALGKVMQQQPLQTPSPEKKKR